MFNGGSSDARRDVVIGRSPTPNSSLLTPYPAVAYANGVTHTYDYNSRNRLTGLQISDAQSVSLNAFSYQLNAAGHRTRIDEATGRTRLFAYDGLNRLTSEQVTGDPAGENGAVVYTHDAVGNRLSRSSTLLGVASQSDAYDVNDRLDSDTYDSNGNTVAASGVTTGDIYDPWNRLVRRFKPDGTVVDLCYDHAGNRVAKTVSAGLDRTSTAYLVDANSLTGYAQVLEELREDGLGGLEVFRTYAAGNDLISQTQLLPDGNGGEVWATHYFLYDGQGSVWGLADVNGAVTDAYTYDAFGLHLREEGAGTPNNIRYTGEMWDADLGQYYLRARYYEPNRGRFWTMDNFEGFNADPISLHKYLYANANPVMYTDPSGELSQLEVAFGVGIIGSLSTICALNHLLIYTQAQLPEYLRNYEMLSEGVDVKDYYAPFQRILNETRDTARSEAYTAYVWGPLLDCAGSALEAARLLRFAKDAEVAMAVPNDLQNYREIMQRLGYKWKGVSI